MNCAYHADRQAIAHCVECSKAVCTECKVEYDGQVFCNACIEKKLVSPNKMPATNASIAMIENTSGVGSRAEVPPDLGNWNWGGFLLTWIWGIGNNVWWSLLALIPFLGPLVMPWVLGFKGNEWAWQNKRWQSVEHFKKVQRTWMWWGLGVLIFTSLVIAALFVIGAMFLIWTLQKSGVI